MSGIHSTAAQVTESSMSWSCAVGFFEEAFRDLSFGELAFGTEDVQHVVVYA